MFAILFLGIVAAVLLAAALGVLVFIGAAFRGEAPETASHHPPDNLSPSSKRRCCNRLMRRQYHSPLVPVTPRLFVAAVRRGRTFRKQVLLLIDVFLVLSVIPFGVGVLLA